MKIKVEIFFVFISFFMKKITEVDCKVLKNISLSIFTVWYEKIWLWVELQTAHCAQVKIRKGELLLWHRYIQHIRGPKPFWSLIWIIKGSLASLNLQSYKSAALVAWEVYAILQINLHWRAFHTRGVSKGGAGGGQFPTPLFLAE